MTFAEERAWVAGLKAGDEVAVWDGRKHTYTTVTKRTPQFVTTADGAVYLVENGKRRGWSYKMGSHPSLEEPTQARHRDACESIRRIDWGKEPLAFVECVLRLRAAGPVAVETLEREAAERALELEERWPGENEGQIALLRQIAGARAVKEARK